MNHNILLIECGWGPLLSLSLPHILLSLLFVKTGLKCPKKIQIDIKLVNICPVATIDNLSQKSPFILLKDNKMSEALFDTP